MSNISNPLEILTLFGKIRRQLNLKAVQALKPLGIGPKQAVVLRKLRELEAASLSELARLTQTDPGATGKIIESLTKKRWVRRVDHPDDRRRWQVSLTSEGKQAARKLEVIYRGIAQEFCEALTGADRSALFHQFSKISSHLDRLSQDIKEEA